MLRHHEYGTSRCRQGESGIHPISALLAALAVPARAAPPEPPLPDGLLLRLTVEGSQTGEIEFRSSQWDESHALSGTWNGKPAALPRDWP